jgi:hypothetical protein
MCGTCLDCEIGDAVAVTAYPAGTILPIRVVSDDGQETEVDAELTADLSGEVVVCGEYQWELDQYNGLLAVPRNHVNNKDIFNVFTPGGSMVRFGTCATPNGIDVWNPDVVGTGYVFATQLDYFVTQSLFANDPPPAASATPIPPANCVDNGWRKALRVFASCWDLCTALKAPPGKSYGGSAKVEGGMGYCQCFTY